MPKDEIEIEALKRIEDEIEMRRLRKEDNAPVVMTAREYNERRPVGAPPWRGSNEERRDIERARSRNNHSDRTWPF